MTIPAWLTGAGGRSQQRGLHGHTHGEFKGRQRGLAPPPVPPLQTSMAVPCDLAKDKGTDCKDKGVRGRKAPPTVHSPASLCSSKRSTEQSQPWKSTGGWRGWARALCSALSYREMPGFQNLQRTSRPCSAVPNRASCTCSAVPLLPQTGHPAPAVLSVTPTSTAAHFWFHFGTGGGRWG